MGRLRTLRDSRGFRRVYAEGRRARSDGITAWAAPPREATGRVGIVVPGSVGSAVARNKVKRRLRAALAQLETGTHDVVVRADGSAGRVRFQELENHVFTAIRRAGAAR